MVDALSPGGDPGRARELEARLILEALPGVGPVTQRRLLEQFGSATAVLRRGQGVLRGTVGPQAVSGARDPELRHRVRKALSEAARMEMVTLIPGDPGYPARLGRLVHPPGVLFLRGRVELLERPGVAIVGARRATARARHVAGRLAAAVARTGCPVVSGLALGVDGAAHRGALEAGGPTVAVMGRGADRAYPRSHSGLFRTLLTQGLVVSEFAPGTGPLPHHFPRRNRIIAALCSTVVVVEAGPKSGASITVEHALDLGLDVWAVPGPIEETPCMGSNRLLGEGARALVSIEAFLQETLDGRPASTGGPPSPSDPREAHVISLLTGGPRSADDLARVSGIEVQHMLAMLSEMELRGWVERAAGMRFRRAS